MSGTSSGRPWQLEDPAWLRERYVQQGMTAREIAATVGAGRETVLAALRHHHIPRRSAAVRPTVAAGERYGRLVVLAEAGRRSGKRAYACRCDCGTETVVRADYLGSGMTRSCGCLQREAAAKRAGQARAKLTASHVRAIRARLAAGQPRATLAEDFGVSREAIAHIASGKRWRHLRAYGDGTSGQIA